MARTSITAAEAMNYESGTSQREYHVPEQTLIIFDWDDTLCPSCWIQDNQPVLSFFRPPPRDDVWLDPLRRLEALVKILLQTAMQMGQVVIVTNAQDPWVETSCKYYLPGALPLIRAMPVIYAHAVYDATGYGAAVPGPPSVALAATEEELTRQPNVEVGVAGAPGMYNQGRTVKAPAAVAAADVDDESWGSDSLGQATSVAATSALGEEERAPQRWKEAAFIEELKRFYGRYEGQSWKNVISVGDALFERDALRHVVSTRPDRQKQCRTKTVKLLDEPTIEELIKQVKLVLDGIEHIVKYDGNLDIELDEDDIGFGMDVVDEAIANR